MGAICVEREGVVSVGSAERAWMRFATMQRSQHGDDRIAAPPRDGASEGLGDR
jgi:hypothetical protein